MVVVFCHKPLPTIYTTGTTDETFTETLEEVCLTHTKKDQIICIKIQAHNSSEPQLVYHQAQTPYRNQRRL